MYCYFRVRFFQDLRAAINWNNQGQLYLHQGHIPQTYSKLNLSKVSAIVLVECNEAGLVSETNVLLPLRQYK